MITPEQHTGKSIDLSVEQNFDTTENAEKSFAEIKQRLSNPNFWKDLCNEASATFYLCDCKGNDKSTMPEVGDTIKIDFGIPNLDGDKFDWVHIEKIIDNENEFSFQVKPCSSPQDDAACVSHIYGEEATNTFQLIKNGTNIKILISGRNEKPNVESDSLLGTARNALLAVGGISFGSEMQWRNLLNGLIK